MTLATPSQMIGWMSPSEGHATLSLCISSTLRAREGCPHDSNPDDCTDVRASLFLPYAPTSAGDKAPRTVVSASSAQRQAWEKPHQQG